LGNLLRNISLSKLVFPGQFATVEAELFGDSSDQIAIEEEAILALHFWLNCHKSEKKNNKSSEQLEDWLRNAAIFAVHRRAQRVQDIDVMQVEICHDATITHSFAGCPAASVAQF
jgi:hypothetical protein